MPTQLRHGWNREDNDPLGLCVVHSQMSFLKSKFLQKEKEVENISSMGSGDSWPVLSLLVLVCRYQQSSLPDASFLFHVVLVFKS